LWIKIQKSWVNVKREKRNFNVRRKTEDERREMKNDKSENVISTEGRNLNFILLRFLSRGLLRNDF